MSYQRRLDIKQFKSKGPMQFLQKLLLSHPEIKGWAALELALEIESRAKAYLSGEESYMEWQPLWEESRELYKWTPEWNKTSRYNAAKRGDDHPLYDTGTLHNSIETEKVSLGVYKVGSKKPYAAIHEFGGPNPLPGHKDIPARPYLTPAFMSVEEDGAWKRYFNRKLNQYITSQIVDKIIAGRKPSRSRRKK